MEIGLVMSRILRYKTAVQTHGVIQQKTALVAKILMEMDGLILHLIGQLTQPAMLMHSPETLLNGETVMATGLEIIHQETTLTNVLASMEPHL